MKNQILDRISLDAFRVFEAAARHRNFSAAARELLVTQAAVSRRLQKLEVVLGTTLFHRNGRRVTLTAKGEALFKRVQAMLDFLSEGLEPLSDVAMTDIVTIWASGAISHAWLSRMLCDYAAENPSITVRLQTTDVMFELASDENDLAILYSRGEHPHWNLVLLFEEELTPVASPDYLAKAGLEQRAGQLTPTDLLDLEIYDYEQLNAYWVTLRDWFQQMGQDPHVLRPRVIYSNYAMTIEAALRGHGVVLGSRHMIADHLQKGCLVELMPDVLVTGYGHYLALPSTAPVSEQTLKLYRWLLSRVGPVPSLK